MSVPWTPGYAERFLARIDDARLATITPRAFYVIPIVAILPLATARQLIEQERGRRAAARRNAAAAEQAPRAVVALPSPAAVMPPRQRGLFD